MQFVDTATKQHGGTIGHGLQSHTSDIRAVRVNHPATNEPMIFIDTPGFNDTSRSDAEILAMIAEWVEMWV
jgi:GTPase Era involved in 16S rRNA processing